MRVSINWWECLSLIWHIILKSLGIDFAIEFFHHVHFYNRNNTLAFPGIDTRPHTRFLHNVSCTSSRLPCNSNALYFVSFLSINHDCADKKEGKRKKQSQIKIPEMDLSTRRIIVKRFDVGETKIGEGEG